MTGQRKVYTPEFKLSVVKMITEQKLSVAETARRLGVTENILHSWKKAVQKSGAPRFPEPGTSRPSRKNSVASGPTSSDWRWNATSEKKATAFFATQSKGPSPGSSATEVRREEWTADVATIHAEAKARDGRPRIHAELVARGHGCGVNTVAQVRREAGIAAKTKRKFRQTTDSNPTHPVAENVLDREFDPVQPNAGWVADVTDIPTREGWVDLAVVLDLFRRAVVGWSMAATMTSRRVVDALEMALVRRRPGSRRVVHSDRGSQSASEHHRRRLTEEGIECRRSRRGHGWDNAPMESFFASLKTEWVHDEDSATREEAKASIVESVEAFDNRVRRHSTLGSVAPADYERTQNPTHR